MSIHSVRFPRTVGSLTAVCVLVMCASLAPSAAMGAASGPSPLIDGLGGFAQVGNPGVRPDPQLDYKVVMTAAKVGDNGEPIPAFERIARLANLLAASGVPADHRHLVVMLYGPATAAVLNADGLKTHNIPPNPNADAIKKLVAAGIGVHVCGQALAGWKIARSEVLPDVQVDLSALTTLSTLQLQGYALLQD